MRACFITVTAAAMALCASPAVDVPVIPRPVRVTPAKGVFVLKPGARLVAAQEAAAAGRALSKAFALEATPGTRRPRGGILVTVDGSLRLPGEEAYRLRIAPGGIEIRGKTAAGAFYGAQTLIQLAGESHKPGVRELRSVLIEDYPRFPWRGAMLDVSRHFLPKDYIFKFIDLLAMQKMNVLHLHLTDDQGWRIEIQKYPKLTEIGSVRKETRVGHEREKKGFDGTPYGGFYTQADLREIVQYAQERFVQVVPEIEMPGHAQAAIAAYPELGNTGERIEVSTRWGVHKDVFNVNESTIRFLQDVLDEVLAIFPSRFIHVGGDEVPLDQWKASPQAQARKKELGLKEDVELHGYFIRRMDQFLRQRGRRLVGWDEILEGGVDPSATVMSWRGNKGGIAAARSGHDVVMAPNTHTYFDYYQAKGPEEGLAIGGFLPLEKVYEFDPTPPELKPEEAKRILGTQGQLWSEYIPSPQRLEYMAFPRLTALAEVAWTPKDRKDYASFLERLRFYEQRWRSMGVNFRPTAK